MELNSSLIAAIKGIKWKSHYTCSDGTVVTGVACSQVSETLRDEGWKGVPKIDEYDLRKAGFKTVLAKYSGGASKTRGKACYVVVL